MKIPGVDQIVAAILIAEIGADMTVFKSASHLEERVASGCNNYKDLDDAYLDHLDQQRVTDNLVRRLERLGYKVALTESTSTEQPAPTTKEVRMA